MHFRRSQESVTGSRNGPVVKKNSLSVLSLLLVSLSLSACGSSKITKPHGNGWTFELLTSGREVGIHSSLATTSDGTVHVAFFDMRHNDLYIARRQAAGEWSITEIDTVGWVGEFVTLCIDQNDHLHLAYQDTWNRRLRYAYRDGTGWTYDHLSPLESRGEAPTMIERPDGIHMVELDTSSRTLFLTGHVNYWWKAPGGWQKLSTIELFDMRPFFDFTIGPNGPVIALLVKDYGGGRAVSSRFAVIRQSADDGAGPWARRYVVNVRSYDSVKYGDRPIAVGFDNNGVSHLVYLGQESVLKDTGSADIDSGVRNSPIVMRTGAGGELWLTYVKGNTIHLSRFTTGSGWERMGRIGDIDPDGRYDMQVDADGIIHVSVYHRSAQKLWYGRWEASP